MSWTDDSTSQLDNLGYILYYGLAGTGEYEIYYDGSFNPDTFSQNVTGLLTGQEYSFYVVSLNYNGASDASDELTAFTCVEPSDFAAPTFISATTTEITLGWTSPEDNGGCPILTYQLFRNAADGSTPSIQVDASSIDDKPYLDEWEVTGLTATGSEYKFLLKAFNEIGSVTSTETTIVLANVPDTPTSIPTQDYSGTSDT